MLREEMIKSFAANKIMEARAAMVRRVKAVNEGKDIVVRRVPDKMSSMFPNHTELSKKFIATYGGDVTFGYGKGNTEEEAVTALKNSEPDIVYPDVNESSVHIDSKPYTAGLYDADTVDLDFDKHDGYVVTMTMKGSDGNDRVISRKTYADKKSAQAAFNRVTKKVAVNEESTKTNGKGVSDSDVSIVRLDELIRAFRDARKDSKEGEDEMYVKGGIHALQVLRFDLTGSQLANEDDNKDDESVNEDASHMAVANEILRQLGGANRLSAMIGAKNFSGGADGRGSLSFGIMRGAKNSARYIKITLNASDLYDVKYYKQNGESFDGPHGIYAEDLRDSLESDTGLRLSL